MTFSSAISVRGIWMPYWFKSSGTAAREAPLSTAETLAVSAPKSA